jgi:signal transduction histidine kinase
VKDTGYSVNRLKFFILVFFVSASLPLAYVIYQSYTGLRQEERSQLLFFSEALFDQMESALAELVQLEEMRAVDEYQYFLATTPGQDPGAANLSPLAEPNYPDYILGYLQVNPDGTFQTPLVSDMGNVPDNLTSLVSRIRAASEMFNEKKFSLAPQPPEPDTDLPAVFEQEQKVRKDSFAERFLRQVEPEESSTPYLGKKQKRVEEITAGQAMNVARDSEAVQETKQPAAKGGWRMSVPAAAPVDSSLVEPVKEEALQDSVSGYRGRAGTDELAAAVSPVIPGNFQVEVAPFQSVALDGDQVYIFRRIVIDSQIYRQGFIILVEPLLSNLVDSYFAGQPLAGFTSLTLQRRDRGQVQDVVRVGVEPPGSGFLVQRVFPPPFDFINISLQANIIPASPARRSLNVALGVLGVVIILGFLTIYQSARAIVNLSERRSQFVASVTHELKTPLTNIRMYIEMLEQGIASTPEREQEYLAILGAESTRLSGLINNVLELARLEKKQRHFDLQEGRLDDVLTEVEAIMSEKLSQEGCVLAIRKGDIPLFRYDREVLVQVLVNLVENSVKFSRQSPIREITITTDTEPGGIRLSVSDSGPGIPAQALKKVFDDFYRVDNDLTRSTGGTGIGLALVKKFVSALGGTVRASNNDGPGCTISIVLPTT